MGFDRDALAAAIAAHGPVRRVVIAALAGSAPREVGAAMLVWDGGQAGTIGGGALEYHAADRARRATADSLTRHPLGPQLGQCCGGTVSLLTEVWDAGRLAAETGAVVARPVGGGTAHGVAEAGGAAGRSAAMPLSVRRVLDRGRARGQAPRPQLLDGWFIEPVHRPRRALWIWGAGHVGRALVHTLSPLPELAITWVDTAAARFPATVPDRVTVLPAADPARAVPHAPPDAEHLILTYSHELDLALCHALLTHGFGHAGLIGSATKWARFRKRLAQLGHAEGAIARIECPIGQPALGKHPQAIAVGVAADLLQRNTTGDSETWRNRSSTSGA
jgi:xanthine dehydrogenase accessory factor